MVAGLNIVEKFNYLGVVLTEFLDYNVMTKVVEKRASRALGILIAKPWWSTFPCLVQNSMVWPVIAVGAAV